jgi:hypothetical protein
MRRLGATTLGVVVMFALANVATANASGSFIGGFGHNSRVASTVPVNGDVNPYGTVVVGRSIGRLEAGAVLVSNFNAKSNLQGTGSTIVEISRGGERQVFAHLTASTLPGPCPGGVGLTTALAVLRHGWVIVGSLPTSDGMAATAKAGCLIVIDRWGHPVETISGAPINGPWDMTWREFSTHADLFVTNVLNGTVAAGGAIVHRGTVVRVDLGLGGTMPQVMGMQVVGSGFPERTDPAALVIGPTGVGLSAGGTLYVADSASNRIAAIGRALTRDESAGRGMTVSIGHALAVPLGLTVAPNGDVLTVNGANGRIVETTPGGVQRATRLLDHSGSPPGAGALFGLAIAPGGRGLYYVDDATNTLNLLH